MFSGILLMGLLSAWSMRAEDVSLAIPEGVLISSGIDVSFVARFALFIAVLLLWTVCWGKLFHKFFRLPIIAGQIIGGIFLGPTLIDIANLSVFTEPVYFLNHTSHQLYALASSDLFVFFVLLLSSALTVSYLLWIAGHETDVQDIIKVGGVATIAGFLGAVLPIGMTLWAVSLLYADYLNTMQSLSIGLVLAATSVSIPVAMLFSSGMMHLKSSKATLGAAIIDDILAVILLSVFFIAVQSGTLGTVEHLTHMGHTVSIVNALVYMAISFAVIFAVGYFCIPPIVAWLHAKERMHLIAPAATGIMLLYFAFAELVGGLAGITGAYFAGLFHRMGDKRHHAEKVISPFTNAVLLPLFLGSIGLQLDISVLNFFQWSIVLVLLTVAVVSKLVACYLAIWMSNIWSRGNDQQWTLLDGFLFGSSMVARGEVGLVVATVLHGSGIISESQYTIAVVVIVLTTVVAPIMLAIGLTFLAPEQGQEGQGYKLNLGLFAHVGSTQMFNIIVAYIESTRARTSVQFSQGRRIVSVDGENLKVILSPHKGIIVEGDPDKIKEVFAAVKSSIASDIERLTLQE